MKAHSIKLWIESVVLGIGLFLFGYIYLYFREHTVGPVINVTFTARSASFSGLTMINLSFALSGMSYFWELGKKYLGYRKMIGVVGFCIVLIHALINSIILLG